MCKTERNLYTAQQENYSKRRNRNGRAGHWRPFHSAIILQTCSIYEAVDNTPPVLCGKAE